MRATSPRRTTVPSLVVTRMMLRNCSIDENSVSPDTVAVKTCPFTAGSAPSEPVANCAFWALTALSTWVVDRP